MESIIIIFSAYLLTRTLVYRFFIPSVLASSGVTLLLCLVLHLIFSQTELHLESAALTGSFLGMTDPQKIKTYLLPFIIFFIITGLNLSSVLNPGLGGYLGFVTLGSQILVIYSSRFFMKNT
jgi:hypothetical protein